MANKRTILSDEGGFSLIEILIALVILSITIFAFTGLFTDSYSRIFSAGRKSQAIYKAQKDMESKIRSGTTLNQDFTITVPHSTNITVKGELVDIEIEGQNAHLTTFVPKQ